MANRVARFVFLAVVLVLAAASAHAQTPYGSLTGTVMDAQGAAVVGADVVAQDDATGAQFSTKSGADGHFRVSALSPGLYTVTITMQGFKKGVFKAVKIITAESYDLTAVLEVGESTTTVVVEAGQEVIETTTATVGETISGKSITQLPFTSRQALELAILMPGASTTGRTRQTSFNGLPKGAMNITIDGINAQDNLLKSSDGFFTIIQPRIDATEEFTVAEAANGAEQNAEGAVQLRFETKRGGNDWHGGVWEYLRNDYLNSNYYFNTITLQSNGKPLPRQVQRLNQFGFKVGGPILKQKLFFFFDLDFYQSPQSRTFTRTILSQAALAGNFTYGVKSGTTPTASQAAYTTCTNSDPRLGAASCTVNLAQFATANGFTFAPDKFMTDTLNAVDSARSVAGVATGITNGWEDLVSFNVPGAGRRRFPDLRVDYNVAKNHTITGIYHYQHFTSRPDFLNNANITFPVAPFNQQQGSQISNRNQYVAAWRWNMASNKSNELRWGLQSSLVSFFPDEKATFYPPASTNLGTINARPVINGLSSLGGFAYTQPFLPFNAQGRNTPVAQLIDNFSWTKGSHNLSFGVTWTEIRFHGFLAGGRQVQTLNTSLTSSNDPVTTFFSTDNFAGTTASSVAPGNAAAVFAALTGRVNSWAGVVSVDPSKRAFAPGFPNSTQTRQREFGFYGSDSWRFRPSLTLTGGLRWEFQGVPSDDFNETFSPVGGVGGALAGLFGPSGAGNLFKPGTLSGGLTTFQLNGGQPWYNNDLNNFAPNVGLAWSPKVEHGFLHGILGRQFVIRAGYSISYTREGVNNFLSIAPSNPGIDGSIFANTSKRTISTACPSGQITTSNSKSGAFPAGCATVSGVLGGQLQTLAVSPASFAATGTFQITPFSGQAVNVFNPNLRTPLVHSWSAGIQRAITNDLVVEVRYVGNHGSGLWLQEDVNEVNIFENGFLQEFTNAQNNLALCQANYIPSTDTTPPGGACGAAQLAAGLIYTPKVGTTPKTDQTTANSFANWGIGRQTNLPVFVSAFAGITSPNSVTAPGAGGCTGSTPNPNCNSNFNSSTFTTPLTNGAAGTLATTLAIGGTGSFICNLAGSAAFNSGSFACPTSAPAVGAFPVNFFQANPQATGGAFVFTNAGHSTYNAVQVEVRHRPAHGLILNANYTFSKSLTNAYADSSVNFATFSTLRNQPYSKGLSPWDLRHQFKLQAIYEMPFGPGKKWSTGNAFINRAIGGWEISAINRVQSGSNFLLSAGSTTGTGASAFGTVSGDDNAGGGLDSGIILNGLTQTQLQSLLGIRKTTGANGNGTIFYFPASLIGSDGSSNRSFIAPCNTPGKLCSRVILRGPAFFRADISVLKRTHITEQVNFEIRAEALNAFNNINFFFPGTESTNPRVQNISSTSFAQSTASFRDPNTTDDNGGRILQIVFRFNF